MHQIFKTAIFWRAIKFRYYSQPFVHGAFSNCNSMLGGDAGQCRLPSKSTLWTEGDMNEEGLVDKVRFCFYNCQPTVSFLQSPHGIGGGECIPLTAETVQKTGLADPNNPNQGNGVDPGKKKSFLSRVLRV